MHEIECLSERDDCFEVVGVVPYLHDPDVLHPEAAHDDVVHHAVDVGPCVGLVVL